MHASTRFEIGRDVAFREIDEEAVVLNLESGTYFGLNRVATRAWGLLAEGRSFGDTLLELEREFDVEADTLERDVRAWLQSVVDKGLLQHRDASASSGEGM